MHPLERLARPLDPKLVGLPLEQVHQLFGKGDPPLGEVGLERAQADPIPQEGQPGPVHPSLAEPGLLLREDEQARRLLELGGRGALGLPAQLVVEPLELVLERAQVLSDLGAGGRVILGGALQIPQRRPVSSEPGAGPGQGVLGLDQRGVLRQVGLRPRLGTIELGSEPLHEGGNLGPLAPGGDGRRLVVGRGLQRSDGVVVQGEDPGPELVGEGRVPLCGGLQLPNLLQVHIRLFCRPGLRSEGRPQQRSQERQRRHPPPVFHRPPP